MFEMVAMLAYILKELTAFISYINNSSFPEPLTREEEKKQLELMWQGSSRARRILIEHNLRLVAHMSKKFEQTGEDPEDLLSIGTIGLRKGINTFDSKKGTRLATYAARCIENEILMFLRAIKKTKQDMSLQEAVGTDREGNELTLLDLLGTDPNLVPNEVEAKLLQKRLQHLIKKLKKREQKVLIMRYGLLESDRSTQKEVASHLGISRSYVSRIEKKAIQKIAAEFLVH